MTWTKLSDDFTDRSAMLEVSRSARLLHIEAMVRSNRMLDDGRITAATLPRITDAEDIACDVDELVRAGLWEPIEGEPGTWQLDWRDQDSAEDVRARQAYQAKKQKLYRKRKALHTGGDHNLCDPRHCSAVVSNKPGNAPRNETGLVTSSRPVPARPVPSEGQGRRQGASTQSPRCDSCDSRLTRDGDCANPRCPRA